MTESDTVSAEEIAAKVKVAELPLRDWILLPLLSLVTILTIAGSTELISRRNFAPDLGAWRDCLVLDDPSTGVRGMANGICRMNFPEGPIIEYKFNTCGHREDIECGSKPAGGYRIVMVGSSIALGMYVKKEQAFATLLPKELSQRTGRKIELYNEGMYYAFPRGVTLRFGQALAAKPDMILWTITPYDIEHASILLTEKPKMAGEHGKAMRRVKEALSKKSVREALPDLLKVASDLSTSAENTLLYSRTVTMLRHFLYKSRSLYLASYLKSGGDKADPLKTETSAELQSYLREVDADVAHVEEQARAAGVPLIIVMLPERAMASLLSMGDWPAGYDPYKLDNELRAIVTKHGGTYIDILRSYRTIPNSERYYFPINGHPDADGHAMIADMLTNALTSGPVPALRAADQTQVVAK